MTCIEDMRPFNCGIMLLKSFKHYKIAILMKNPDNMLETAVWKNPLEKEFDIPCTKTSYLMCQQLGLMMA